MQKENSFSTLPSIESGGEPCTTDISYETRHSNENVEYGEKKLLQLEKPPPTMLSITDSPTIVKSRSLTKKIRERQIRDSGILSGFESEDMIPAIHLAGSKGGNGEEFVTGVAFSTVGTIESSPFVGNGKHQIPSVISTPNRTRTNSNNGAATLDSVGPTTLAPADISMPLLKLQSIQSALGAGEAVPEGVLEALKPRVVESSTMLGVGGAAGVTVGGGSPPVHGIFGSSPSCSAKSSSIAASSSHNHSSSTAAMSIPSVSSAPIPVSLHSAFHQNSGSSKTSERNQKKPLEKIVPPEDNSHTQIPASSSNRTLHHRSSSGPAAAGGGKLSALSYSSAHTSAKARVSSSSASTLMAVRGLAPPFVQDNRQYVLAVESTQVHQKVSTNSAEDDIDRIVKERLQEAKALDRKSTPGAVMHQFSLWNKAPQAAASSATTSVPASATATASPSGHPADDVQITPRSAHKKLAALHHNTSPTTSTLSNNAIGTIWNGDPAPSSSTSTNSFSFSTAPASAPACSSTSSAKKTKFSKLRGPKAARETHTSEEEEAIPTQDANSSFNTSLTDPLVKVTAGEDSHDGLEDEYTMEFEQMATISAQLESGSAVVGEGEKDVSLHGSGSLAMALRRKVGGAKQPAGHDSSLSPIERGTSEVKQSETLGHVYSTPEKKTFSFVQHPSTADSHELQQAMVDEEFISDEEIEEDVWNSDAFADENDICDRLLSSGGGLARPRSAEPGNATGGVDPLSTPVILSMSKSGPAAFATLKVSASLNASNSKLEAGFDNYEECSKRIDRSKSKNNKHTKDNSQDKSKDKLKEKSADHITAQTTKRRATTSGSSRHFVNKLENLVMVAGSNATDGSAGRSDGGKSPLLKSMTSRSASEHNIEYQHDARLHLQQQQQQQQHPHKQQQLQAVKGSSSKYQTLRNLKSNNKSSTKLSSSEKRLGVSGETTTLAPIENKSVIMSALESSGEARARSDTASTINTHIPLGSIAATPVHPNSGSCSSSGSRSGSAEGEVLVNEGKAQSGGDPTTASSQHAAGRRNNSQVDDHELSDINGNIENHDGDESSRGDESPTLSEMSDTEDAANIKTRLSPLRVDLDDGGGRAGNRERNSSDFNQVNRDNDQEEDQVSPLRWRKGEAIGEGTFGVVYKGMNEKTGELLAIKQLCLIDGTNHEVESLQKEISVMWNLVHENIVRYLGTSKTERYLFIILEYVTGGSIASMISQFGPFNEKLIKRFSLHILTGVDYLHSKGIIHRDIKGANILVSGTGVAKLADFGCSKQLAGMCTASIEESLKAIRGSVPWMAPEVIKQSGHGRSSDIWSVGATVIEMATGQPPWPEFTSSMATLFHVATSKTPPPMPSQVSLLCCDFIGRCLMIEPTERSSAQELLTECEFLTGSAMSSAASTGVLLATAAATAAATATIAAAVVAGVSAGSGDGNGGGRSTSHIAEAHHSSNNSQQDSRTNTPHLPAQTM